MLATSYYFMLPKNRRIQKKQFSSVVLLGKRYNSEHFLAYINRIDKDKPSLFSFSVSKKVCKSAVGRNRLRRQGYSIVSKNLEKISSGYTCFFSFKKVSKLPSFNEIEGEIEYILKKADLI